ncbi:MAG TPA: hypothetical protein VF794_19970, partial [Archangium sp.]|uniref:hypothetical protein n=1 Tax=Archangium sp. TaxID=1872627 RepID=UPI002EDAF4A7
MRMLLFLVAVLAAGYAGHVYLGTRAQTPYSAYSEDQLAQMEAENQRLLPKTRGDAAIERQVSLQLLQEERQRRQRLQHLPIAAGGAVLALIASILVRSRARSDEPSSDEE